MVRSDQHYFVILPRPNRHGKGLWSPIAEFALRQSFWLLTDGTARQCTFEGVESGTAPPVPKLETHDNLFERGRDSQR